MIPMLTTYGQLILKKSHWKNSEINIPCGFTNALYALSATTDDQMADHCILLDTHITAEFAAAVPIRQFMLDEGIKVFTNMQMNWDGIKVLSWTGRRIHQPSSSRHVGQ